MILGHAVLDETHAEFLDMVNRLADATDALPILDDMIAHTDAHFALEESWMARINFPAAGCHVSEHKQIIGVMRMVRQRVANGDTEFVAMLATELAAWLPIHVDTMDYALTNFMEVTGATV